MKILKGQSTPNIFYVLFLLLNTKEHILKNIEQFWFPLNSS